MRYTVQRTDVRHAGDVILPIWATNLTVDGDLEQKLRWFYCDGPHGPGDAFLLHAGEAAKAVGCAGVGVRTLWHRDRAIRTALFADLAVDRTHRSGFPALALLRAVTRHIDREFELGYGFPNDKASAVYMRAGYRELGVMPRYVRVLQTRGYLERRTWPAVASVAGALLDLALSARARLRAMRTPGSFDLVWVNDFDTRFDQLWLDARATAPLLCERTSELLRWRFACRVPGDTYRIATSVEPTTRRLRAYAVIRLTPSGVAEISDLFGAGIADLDTLLSQLVPALAELRCSAVSMRFLGAARIPNLLASHGFSRRVGGRSVVVSLGVRLREARELRDVESWYLTDLDEDV